MTRGQPRGVERGAHDLAGRLVLHGEHEAPDGVIAATTRPSIALASSCEGLAVSPAKGSNPVTRI